MLHDITELEDGYAYNTMSFLVDWRIEPRLGFKKYLNKKWKRPLLLKKCVKNLEFFNRWSNDLVLKFPFMISDPLQRRTLVGVEGRAPPDLRASASWRWQTTTRWTSDQLHSLQKGLRFSLKLACSTGLPFWIWVWKRIFILFYSRFSKILRSSIFMSWKVIKLNVRTFRNLSKAQTYNWFDLKLSEEWMKKNAQFNKVIQ